MDTVTSTLEEAQALARGLIGQMLQELRTGRGGYLNSLRIGAALLEVHQHLEDDAFYAWAESSFGFNRPTACSQSARPPAKCNTWV